MRHVSVTGGEKEVKAERYDLLPWDVIEEDARLYGRGAEKYAEPEPDGFSVWFCAQIGRHSHEEVREPVRLPVPPRERHVQPQQEPVAAPRRDREREREEVRR